MSGKLKSSLHRQRISESMKKYWATIPTTPIEKLRSKVGVQSHLTSCQGDKTCQKASLYRKFQVCDASIRQDEDCNTQRILHEHR